MPIRVESQAEPIPGYKLIERLGGGGFGEVWKAEAPGGLLKAIKFVHGDLDTVGDEGQRAEQELKALARVKSVRHPYILSLERYDIIDGKLMIVMELADRNLWDRFKECRGQGLPGIPRDELLGYLEETAEALDLMNIHYQLQHLDIKPQNLFLVHNHIKVADFGLVKDLQGRNQVTMTGGVTPVYAAPETFDGILSRFCDQYSLAIVYQEMLTGQRPFAGATVHQLVMQHVQGKPNLAPLSEADRKVVARALAKKPEARHATCTDFVRGLRVREAAAADQAGLATPPPLATPTHHAEAGTPRPRPAEAADEIHPTEVARPSKRTATTPEPGTSAAVRDAVVPELAGEGDLLPAVVIGLGQLGGVVLRHLRDRLCDHYGESGGAPESLPHLRLLNMDTDPHTLQSSRASRNGAETLLVRLNRASHYIKPRDGRPPLDSWFDTQMLYRIQRNQGTSGLRALGRLAFVDNYRALAGRLRHELRACSDPRSLAAAVANTGQELRSNKPRVYIVTSLGGGCGSGMFLDLAYLLRKLLRDQGHARLEVVGLLLLPPVQIHPTRKPQSSMPLGNTFAALKELDYYSSGVSIYSARFDTREPALTDAEPPFDRCILLGPAKGQEATAPLGLAGEFLFRDLTTPLGRAADACRAVVLTAAHPGHSRFLAQTIGLYRLAWPKRALVKQTARRLCLQLVQRWVSKEAKAIKDQVQQEIQDQWAQKELGPESPIARLQECAEKSLGRAPEEHFAAVVEAVIPKDLGGKGTADFEIAPLTAALNDVQELLGKPAESVLMYQPGRLEEVLSDRAKSLGVAWQSLLSDIVLPFIDRPKFRLAGAEEAARQLIVHIEKVLHLHEALGRELTDKGTKGKERLLALVKTVPEMGKAGRRSSEAADLAKLLRSYPKWRYQAVVLKQVNALYTSLRGFLSDRVMEINYCRARLLELVKAFAADEKRESDEAPAVGPGRDLFPDGCRDLEEAVEKKLVALAAEQIDDLDQKMQDLVQREFESLFQVCSVTSTAFVHKLGYAMEEEAAAFADKSISGDDVVAMFQAGHADDNAALDDLEKAFDAAAPALGGSDHEGASEICLLAVPPGPNADLFRDGARRAVPETELVPADSADDIVFYRERTQVLLLELEYLGDLAREAYQQMTSMEHFTPHTRLDIAEWT